MHGICEICEQEESKYCCPGCAKRTCSLKCVKEHKEKFDCKGLNGRPVTPIAQTTEKYCEDLFMKDYAFLEGISSYTDKLQLEHSNAGDPEVEIKSEDGENLNKMKEFRKIMRVGKLTEFRALPKEFTRAKRNRTRLITDEKAKNILNEEECEGEEIEAPEKKSSRSGKIAWSIDFVDYCNGSLMETIHNVPDDKEFRSIIPDRYAGRIKRSFLRNETRTRTRDDGESKWREIEMVEGKSLGKVLVGGRFFEYPQIGLELLETNDSEVDNTEIV